MKDQAVIDAYLGAHADTDLGTVSIKVVEGKASEENK
jgi:branched-chain amino acid transport system ATP-binding protein